MLRIFASNRLETLAELLAETIETPLSSPLIPEVIVVQSRGMERWVSMQLAARNRICANIRFPFPNAFLHDLFRTVWTDIPDDAPFDPDSLTFRLMGLILKNMDRPDYEPLQGYLAIDPFGLKRFQLSEKIARLYDQYMVFRPDMLFAWEEGKESHWQADLWRKSVQGIGGHHRARLRMSFLKEIHTRTLRKPPFPERIAIFGISHLPDFHVRIFSQLSEQIPVNLFLMNPCREFWGDILPGKDRKRIRRRYGPNLVADEDLHLEPGNRLLAALGKLGRDFFNILMGYECDLYERYEPAPSGTLLAAIQSDILTLDDPDSNGDPDRTGNPSRLSGDDNSIMIHSCHSPMREIEVLHDNLLSMFEAYPGLLPKDIIVMTPDIDTYAPIIQAVFGTQAHDELRIPHTIADRHVRSENRVVDAFTGFLEFKSSRFESRVVLSFLEFGCVRKKFGISEADLATINHWVREAGIRWGKDGKTRERMDLPEIEENTWKAGIERLLLGYAMKGHGQTLFAGILPHDAIEGSEVIVLGRFIEFVERLFRWSERIGGPESLSGWSRIFNSIIDQFFHSDEETERDIQMLRSVIDRTGSIQTLSDFSEPIPLEVARLHLLHQFDNEGYVSGFISGGVTFCAMLPMRSIPFDIVCLIGMNSNAFPRETRHIGFDLMAKHPKPGDRSRRDDDRYLFLEAIISARKRLYISYVGQSAKDLTAIPPSVLVSELTDYLSGGYGMDPMHLLTQHRLQSFSPAYFRPENPDLVSYSSENMRASARLIGPKSAAPFISTGLMEPGTEWQNIRTDHLRRFFPHPARFILQQRLGIYYGGEGSLSEEEESFSLKPLDRYWMGQELVQQGLCGVDLETLFPAYRASGRLPHGSVGEFHFRELCEAVDGFVKRVRSVIGDALDCSLEIDIDMDPFTIQGELNHGYPDMGLVRYRLGNVTAKDLLETWIDHLLLCESGASGIKKRSRLIGTDSIWEFKPVDQCRSLIGNLISTYWSGLASPLPFFPRSSFKYATLIIEKGKSVPDARQSARNVWLGSDFNRGESEDLYFRRCFGTYDPIDDQFETISLEIFEPLLAHGESKKG